MPKIEYVCNNCGSRHDYRKNIIECKMCEKELCVSPNCICAICDSHNDNKATLYKVEMYILDIDKHYGGLTDLMEHINDRFELVSFHPFNIESVEFEWCDEHVLNKSSAKYEDFKEMFEEDVDDGFVRHNKDLIEKYGL